MMNYNVTFNGVSVDLATPTRKILKEKDEVISQSNKYLKNEILFDTLIETMYNCAILILKGEENLKKVIEHESIDDIDFVNLELLLLNCFEAYNKPKMKFIENANKEKINNSLNSIPVDKLKILNDLKN